MRRAVFLSPHLDDAAFSAGGTIAVLSDAGWRCEVITVFTASVPNPTGFALACQTDKGLPPDADYMAIRRAEDVNALAHLGVSRDAIHHLPLREAPHRGYTSAAALFAGILNPDLDTTAAVAKAIEPFVADADRIYGPFGFGNHVDHLHVIRAADQLGLDLYRWADTPYVMRQPIDAVAAWPATDITSSINRKVAACRSYETQVGFQFGSPDEVGSALRGFASRVGRTRTCLAEPNLPPGLATAAYNGPLT